MGLLGRLFGGSGERGVPAHETRLRKAAGIGTARIRCHEDTWDYLLREFDGNSESRSSRVFRPASEDGTAREEGGMLLVTVSGSSLAALLDRCHRIQFMAWSSSWNYSQLDKAIAHRVEAAISNALTTVVPATQAGDSELTILLDDRPVAARE